MSFRFTFKFKLAANQKCVISNEDGLTRKQTPGNKTQKSKIDTAGRSVKTKQKLCETDYQTRGG